MGAETPKTKGTILIVDDEVDTIFFISKVFQPLGYHTVTANSGMDALRYLRDLAGKIDLVLLDLRMPEMGGVEVLKLIRRDYKNLPVIILTAYGEEEEKVREIGVEAFMTKPYSLQELYDRIARVLERKQFEKAEYEIDKGMIPSAKVLIVDDETDVCEILGETLTEDLEDVDFTVKAAGSGEEALRVAKEFQPDIVIVDIKMPHMWGDELIVRMKRGEGGAVPKDFIVFTAKDDEEEMRKAHMTGYKFIPKTEKLDEVVKLLKKTCVKHQLIKKKI